MQFGTPKKNVQLLYSWPAIAGLAVVIVLLSQSVWERYQVKRGMEIRFVAAQSEYEAFKQRREELTEKVEYMQGARGVEEELRRNFDVARPGEQIVILTGAVPALLVDALESPPSPPWWQFWKN